MQIFGVSPVRMPFGDHKRSNLFCVTVDPRREGSYILYQLMLPSAGRPQLGMYATDHRFDLFRHIPVYAQQFQE